MDTFLQIIAWLLIVGGVLAMLGAIGMGGDEGCSAFFALLIGTGIYVLGCYIYNYSEYRTLSADTKMAFGARSLCEGGRGVLLRQYKRDIMPIFTAYHDIENNRRRLSDDIKMLEERGANISSEAARKVIEDKKQALETAKRRLDKGANDLESRSLDYVLAAYVKRVAPELVKDEEDAEDAVSELRKEVQEAESIMNEVKGMTAQ